MKPGLFIYFVSFPCSWIRIRIPISLLRIRFRIQDSQISANPCGSGSTLLCFFGWLPCGMWPEPVFKIEIFGKESTLFNRNHKHSLRGWGQIHRLFCESTPYLPLSPTLFCSNYFHKELTLFEKSVASWIGHCIQGKSWLFETTCKKVDSVEVLQGFFT